MNAAVALIALKTIETRAALVGQVHSMYLVESTFWKLVPETVEGWVAKVSTYRDPAHLYVGLRERFVYYCASLQSTLLSISSFEKCLIWPKCSLQLLPWNVFLAALESSLLQVGASSQMTGSSSTRIPLFLIPIPLLPTDFCPLWWIYVGFLDGFWQNVNNAFFNEFSIGEDALSKRREARDPNDLMFSNRMPPLFCQLTVFLFI